jgi:excisionase family DNA binding protein
MQTELEIALIGITHLAERLGLSRRTIHRLISRGELPTIKIGRRTLISHATVAHWLARHEAGVSHENVPNITRRFR